MFRKSTILTQKCPVCKTILGSRDTEKFFMALCEDCDHYYSWLKGEEMPTAVPRKVKERKECGCASCKARDNKLGS